jgi:hypothetical protein
LRVFRPQLSHELSLLKQELTKTRDTFAATDEKAKGRFTELLEAHPDDQEVLRALFDRIFPAALRHVGNTQYGSEWMSTWRTAHRMAHIDYLSLYFERVAPDELVAFWDSEQAFRLMSDGDAFYTYLSGLDPDRLEIVVEGLTTYETKFSSDMIVPASVTLLNLIDKIPQATRGGVFTATRREITVARVILRLLRRVEDEATREALVLQIIPQIETYSSQLDFIQLTGYHENSGQKLVSEALALRIYAEFVVRIQETPPLEPSREWDAWRIYNAILEQTGTAPLAPTDDPILLLAVLQSLKSTSRTQAMSSRLVKIEDRLSWDLVIEIFGSEDSVRQTIANVSAVLGEHETLHLAEKYVNGWRPEVF